MLAEKTSNGNVSMKVTETGVSANLLSLTGKLYSMMQQTYKITEAFCSFFKCSPIC